MNYKETRFSLTVYHHTFSSSVVLLPQSPPEIFTDLFTIRACVKASILSMYFMSLKLFLDTSVKIILLSA